MKDGPWRSLGAAGNAQEGCVCPTVEIGNSKRCARPGEGCVIVKNGKRVMSTGFGRQESRIIGSYFRGEVENI